MTASPPRILVVEDDLDMLDTFVQVLETSGYTVFTAVHGRDALDKLARQPRPELILLDLMMPVMTGWELHARLAADPELASIPVVFISAAGAPTETTSPPPAGYLRKPVELHVLLDTIRRICDSPA